MKVFCYQPGSARIPGGHSVQLQKTQKALQAEGVDFQIHSTIPRDISRYDIAHIFDYDIAKIREVRDCGLPVALSTIYWNRDYYIFGSQRAPLSSWRRRIRLSASIVRSVLTDSYPSKLDSISSRWQVRRICCEMADLLLPNSEMEAKALRDDLQVTTAAQVVPNAVDDSIFQLPRDKGSNWTDRNGVIYVGRFEPHKNQLGLIQAMRASPLYLKLIGPPHPDHSDYVKRCERELANNHEIISHIDHDELACWYQRSRVHVLPSWFETTGLVSLEAALSGCNIVTTNRGYACEYFGDRALYVDHAYPRSIRSAIETAHADEPNAELQSHVRENFTWCHTARATAEGYQRLLKTSRRARISTVGLPKEDIAV